MRGASGVAGAAAPLNRMIPATLCSLGLIMAMAAPAGALCIYNGVDNAKTTIAQEFSDSRWVVRARVLSAKDGEVGSGPDVGTLWTVYRLEVVRAYKGQAAKRLRFYTERDSGAFYMDKAWLPLPAGHDIGGEYLLFLNPLRPYRGQPPARRGAAFVNYNCGQSQEWMKLPVRAKAQLERFQRTKKKTSP